MCAAFVAAAFCLPAHPQSAIPRTLDGHPDFHGVWGTRWTTALERPQGATALTLSLEEGASLHRATIQRLSSGDPLGADHAWDFTGALVIDGEARSSLLVDPADGRLPYTEEGRARRARLTMPFTGDENPEQRSLTERCLQGGSGHAPFLSIPAGNIRQVVQTRDTILFHTETFNALRIIPLGGGRGPALPRGGSSSGRWEGDTLVVVTENFLDSDRYRIAPGSTFAISPATRITERFAFDGPDAVRYRFTVEDPLLYRAPWTAETLMTRQNQPVYEFACHEGNYALAGILGGARAVERRAPAE